MATVDLKNPSTQKLLLSIVMFLALLAVYFFTHLLPFNFPNQQEKLNVLKAQYEKKSTDLARARATVADLPRFEAEYGQLHEQWLLAAELLPTDRDLPALLRKISLSGQQTGVTFVSFRPQPLHSENYYNQLPVQISVQGGYHQVASFLAELANLRRIVTVSDVHLKSNTNTANANMTTAADFTASAYSLNTTPVQPPATTAPKKATDEAGSDKEGDSHARKGS